MTTIKRTLAIFLLLALCVPFVTGCGGQEDRAVPEATPEAAKEEAGGQEPVRYQGSYYDLTDEGLTTALQNGAELDGSLWFTALGVLEDRTPEGVTPEWKEQYWVYGPILCRAGLDGSVERIPYTPESEAGEGERESVVFEKLCAAPDGTLWILEKHSLLSADASAETEAEAAPAAEETGEEAESPAGREVYVLSGVKTDGTPVSRIRLDNLDSHAAELQGAEGDYTLQMNALATNGSGKLLLSLSEWFVGRGNFFEDNRVLVLNTQTGSAEASLSLDSAAEHLALLPDGSVAAFYYEGAKPSIGILDLQTGKMGSVWPVGDYADQMAAAPDGSGVWYSAGDSLYRLNPEDGEVTKVLGWTESDVMHDASDSFCLLSDGRIAAVHGKESSGGVRNELAVLTPTADAGTGEKEILRLAVLNLYPFTSEMVIRFNRSHSDVRIEVTDYSEYNDYTSDDENDWNAGVNRLQTEIIAGNAPDIIDISLLSADRFGSSGLLEDLWPLIDADPELSREGLQEHVLSAFSQDGKLYQTVSNFYILTTAGLTERVGSELGWTMTDLQNAMAALRAENPDATVFDRFITADDALTFLLYLELEDYVDWTTGECFFDSESFVQLLEFVAGFPQAFDWEAENPTLADMDSDARLMTGMQLLKQCNFNRFEDAQGNMAGLGGTPVTFVGYPTENGLGAMFAQIGNSFAITAGCKNKEAAWEFVRQFFLPDYQEQFTGACFPTNLSVYEDMKREAMTVIYEKNPDGSYVLNQDGSRKEAERDSTTVNGRLYTFDIVSDEDVALVEKMIAATNRVLGMDDSMKAIITEGAAPFFAGQRSAEEAAKLIQSKAALYVNEQR